MDDLLKVLEKMRLGHCGALNLAKVMRDYAADGELEGVNSPEEFDEGIEESRATVEALTRAIAIIKEAETKDAELTKLRRLHKAAEAIVPAAEWALRVAGDDFATALGESDELAARFAATNGDALRTFLAAMKEG